MILINVCGFSFVSFLYKVVLVFLEVIGNVVMWSMLFVFKFLFICIMVMLVLVLFV